MSLALVKACTLSTSVWRAWTVSSRHGDESFGFERVVKGLIDDKENVRARGCGVLIFGFGVIFGTGKQISGAAEIGDELGDADAVRCAREKDWVVEKTGGKAASGIGIHCGETEISVGHQSRTRFADVLLRGESAQSADGDLRIIFESDGFGLRQSEGRAGLRLLLRRVLRIRWAARCLSVELRGMRR